jgi:protein SCO1
MNRRAMTNARTILTALALSLAATACSPPAPDMAEAPLAGAKLGGAFTLTDSKGQTVTDQSFKGRFMMVYFGYAYCPDICPFDMQRMVQGYQAFATANPDLADDVVPVFITIDPERDTPKVVGEFTSAFSDEVVGLTGTPEQIAAVTRAYAAFYSKQEPNAEGGYLMDHSRGAYLMGRDGQPIALLPVDESAEGVTKVLDQWVS